MLNKLNLTYLIENFAGESFSTLTTLVRLFSIVEALVMLLQVADPVETLVALVTPEVSAAGIASTYRRISTVAA